MAKVDMATIYFALAMGGVIYYMTRKMHKYELGGSTFPKYTYTV